jgi:hypothetical protein
VIIELRLVFPFAVQFSHMLERIKHGLYDFLVSALNDNTNFEAFRPNELVLDACYVRWEEFDERGYSLSLFTCQLSLFNAFDLLSLSWAC